MKQNFLMLNNKRKEFRNMKSYIKPKFEISNFEVEDIITVSGEISVKADIDGGSTEFVEGWEESPAKAADLIQ